MKMEPEGCIEPGGKRFLQDARVVANVLICRDHYRLTMVVSKFCAAAPGQFLHIAQKTADAEDYRTFDWDVARPDFRDWTDEVATPMLRRAYSIADLRVTPAGVELDIIYRVVGKGTHWLGTLQAHDELSVLGPLGNSFPISSTNKNAWLIAGGVGLPPMLWLAKCLCAADRNTTLFYGAQTADLLAVKLRGGIAPDSAARVAQPCIDEFTGLSAKALLSTDDGSVGFHGHVGAALTAFAAANPPDKANVVLYTCGPERMMRFVADFCTSRGIEGYVCMERAMACGTGTCQSCVVAIPDTSRPDNWRYSLCCTEGPVYAAAQVHWETPAAPVK